MAYKDCELPLLDIIKKMSHHHSLVEIFLKNYKKIVNLYQKAGCGCKRRKYCI